MTDLRAGRELAWRMLISNLRTGQCTPFLGAGASAGHIPLGAVLAAEWARLSAYPFKDSTNLGRVMQYVASVDFAGDLVSLKEHLAAEVFAEVQMPDFRNVTQIHSLLARCDLPVYITTNYDDLLFRALTYHEKRPRLGVSPWTAGIEDQFDSPFDALGNYHPSPEEPLVFHLHGHWKHPRSMVLAEDDYIEYLIRLVEEGSTKDDRSMIPPVVHAALRTKPLLFIGYSLHDWTFLVLFRTLLRDVDTSYRRRHVSVQLEPPMAEDIGSAKTYLEEAFRERHIAIFWESTESFTSELARRMWGEAR